VEPTARPLRFLDPDPMKRPDSKDVQRYLARARDARKIVGTALAAYKSGDEKTFVAMWKKDYAGNAKRELENGRRYDKKRSYRWDLLPVHAHTPDLLRQGISSVENANKVVVYRRRWKDGKVYDEDSVWLEKEDGRWRISSW
jgi:ketosteroid isomerase-like protein